MKKIPINRYPSEIAYQLVYTHQVCWGERNGATQEISQDYWETFIINVGTQLNIILTQLRCNASFLNYDLCKVKNLSNASCNCGAPCENSHHFFFDCDKYTDNREIIFNSLNWLPSNINIDVNLLTKGSDLLTYEENITIFKHAFKYIKDSKRFTIV